jgi:hypothetical protein
VTPLAVSQKEKRRQEGRIWIGFIEAGFGGRKKGSKTGVRPSPWKLFSTCKGGADFYRVPGIGGIVGM